MVIARISIHLRIPRVSGVLVFSSLGVAGVLVFSFNIKQSYCYKVKRLAPSLYVSTNQGEVIFSF